MVFSSGSRAVSARSTVSPPTPLSNTPMGASAFTRPSVSWRRFRADEDVGDQADGEVARGRVVRPVEEMRAVGERADAEDGETVRALGQAIDARALDARGVAGHRSGV